jgi:WD40 repeat protein
VDSLAFRPDGKQLASGSDDRTIRLWSTSTGRPTAVLRGHTDMVTSLGYGSGGTELVSGSQDGTLRLWSVAAAKQQGKELGAPLVDVQGQYVQALAVSPDGSGVVAGNGGALDRWPLSPAGWARAACSLAGRDLTVAEWRTDAPGVHPHRLC